MRFGVLGPVAVWAADGTPVRVPDLKVRALLADLLVEPGRPISTSRLIDDLWGERLPANPTNTLQTRVSQLRRALEEAEPGARELVASQAPGYALRADPESVDAGRFRALVARARAAERPDTRAGLLADALALWRGPAYADFAERPFVRAAVDRLEEERLAALEERAEARLELGEHDPVVGELADLVARHPLRQRLRAAQMRALYRAGRHSEALDTYRELRERLAELGLDPTAQLAELHTAILRQDPVLAPPPVAAPSRTNLPTPLTALIGRDAAVAQVRERLGQGRLVTLTGPGGVGKTRLAVAAAQQEIGGYPDGAWLADLAPLDPGTATGQALTAALDLPPGTDPVEWLAGKRLLLVLDNCEHVVEPVAKLTEQVLRAAPGVRVLATSREPLGLSGELLWPVPPLELPDPDTTEPDVAERFSAVQLFVARAAAAMPAFRLGWDNARAVAAICRRLDGLPLALELAATRVPGLGVAELAGRIEDRFRLLSTRVRGVPDRQQTLQAVIDWSWGLLTEPERVVLRRLSYQAGVGTLRAAEAICAGDGVDAADVLDLLARLVDRSLVSRQDSAAGARYQLLESVREYGLARLREAGELDRVRERHDRYYAGLADRAVEPRLYGHGHLAGYLRSRSQPEGGFPLPRRSTGPVATVRSRDGTTIAYTRTGTGPPVILIGGALNDRTTFEPLAEHLAGRFTVYSYDRRGRGGSGDNPPYAVARELEDLAAVVAEAGEPAYGFGVSSGAVLAVDAAARGVPLTRLALVEPPFILDETRPPMPVDAIAGLAELIAAGRRGDAVEVFLTVGVEMPAEVVAPMRSAPAWPVLEAMAHTIGYDLAIMGDFQLPAHWAEVRVPTLVMDGGASAEWRRNATQAAADILPYGQRRTLDGHPHDAPAEVLAPILTDFFTG
jgi:predicted ATPase/DNA-binding SARP family transcriptional activator